MGMPVFYMTGTEASKNRENRVEEEKKSTIHFLHADSLVMHVTLWLFLGTKINSFVPCFIAALMCENTSSNLKIGHHTGKHHSFLLFEKSYNKKVYCRCILGCAQIFY